MSHFEAPDFVRAMGHKIVGYILNLDEDHAKRLIEGNADLSPQQASVFRSYVQLCRDLRVRNVDAPDVGLSVSAEMSRPLPNGRHIFNVMRELSGGPPPMPFEDGDDVVRLLYRLAAEAYPLFLIESTNYYYRRATSGSGIYFLPDRKAVLDAIVNDASLRRMFSYVGGELDTIGNFRSSSGRGGSIQLGVLPSQIINNAFEWMRVRGWLSPEKLCVCIAEIVNVIRSVAEGRKTSVPVFMGFHNVSLDGCESLSTDWGIMTPYNEGLLEVLPPPARPPIGDGHALGFVLETEYPYAVIFDADSGIQSWPPELKRANEDLTELREKVGLTFALALERTPPVGINPVWTIIVDPLSLGLSLSWIPHAQSPVPFYGCAMDTGSAAIQKWSSTISNADHPSIRIAVRRVLSSIAERINPIDGFVDSIIALENLFGGETELSFRISAAVACLLEDDPKARLQLQKKVAKLYQDRSKVVHGRITVKPEEAAEREMRPARLYCDASGLYTIEGQS